MLRAGILFPYCLLLGMGVNEGVEAEHGAQAVGDDGKDRGFVRVVLIWGLYMKVAKWVDGW